MISLATRWSVERFPFTEVTEKHMYGEHDQSKHAPKRVAGVPEGIDLEGKRLSTAAKLEFAQKVNDYQNAFYQPQSRGYAAEEKKYIDEGGASNLAREVVNQAYWSKNPTPDQQAIKDRIQAEIDADPQYQAAKAALEENYLFRDAMNIRDANGVRLGDKGSLDDPYSPAGYMTRSINVYQSMSPSDYDKDFKTYNKEIDEAISGYRTTAETASMMATEDFIDFANRAESVVILPQSKLNQVLADGRYKTVHETGQSQAATGGGSQSYTDHRLIYENAAFGYTNDTPLEARPISGLLVGKGGYPLESHKIYGGKNAAEIVLKPEVRERTTWTLEDSLNTFGTATTIAETKFPAGRKAVAATLYRDAFDENYFDSKPFASSTTVEIQVHGGIKTSDIAKVRFYSPPSKAVAARLERQGIPYETVPLPSEES